MAAVSTPITASTHPAIHAAFDAWSLHCGDEGGQETYYAPADDGYDLGAIEAALAGLDGWGADPVPEASDFRLFCVNGDGVDAIVGRSAELTAANGLLEGMHLEPFVESPAFGATSGPIVDALASLSDARRLAFVEDLSRSVTETVRDRIAREWLASFDDVRHPDYAFADRLLGQRGIHEGDCPLAERPVPATCSACVVEDALAFADRALGIDARSHAGDATPPSGERRIGEFVADRGSLPDLDDADPRMEALLAASRSVPVRSEP